jgi:hypothetical protein
VSRIPRWNPTPARSHHGFVFRISTNKGKPHSKIIVAIPSARQSAMCPLSQTPSGLPPKFSSTSV